MSQPQPVSTELSAISVRELKGVGPSVAAKLENLHITSIADLLFHLPSRYEDRTTLSAISSLRHGQRALVRGTVEMSDIAYGRRRSLTVRISDESGTCLELRFFYFSAAQQKRLRPGTEILAYGEVRSGRYGAQIIHPEVTTLSPGQPARLDDRLTPIYPVTEGLHQISLRKLIEQALALMANNPLPELLPGSFLKQHGLGSLRQALEFIHQPPVGVSLETLEDASHPACQRLILEELLAHHLSLLKLKEAASAEAAAPLKGQDTLASRFLEKLHFSPTGAQSRVTKEILTDLEKPHPMLRLVQGDVGAGKTLVAALAALRAIEAGYQVALMAPTEILAEQHASTFAEWLDPLGLDSAFLISKLPAKQRRTTLASIESGEAKLIVGTHALFQQEVQFHNLGLAIIDEQHRFGVHQRLALKDKSAHPDQQLHQLVMTATPIPRTLAMTLYADMDVSIIDELPPGRTPVTTVALPDSRRDEVIERLRSLCAAGRQVYWVCTLIEESEELQCQAAEASAALLQAQLPELHIGLVHGRLKSAEKQQLMTDFKAGKLQVLVATTVIEVGVDVPNASLMVIENPERLGLAQLHQLRGRVGRGAAESHCLLLYKPPLSQLARERLKVMRETSDGFRIAEKDLELRGPGEVLGVRQTGMVSFKFADLVRDRDLLPRVQKGARQLLDSDPARVEALIRRWIGSRVDYAAV